MSEKRQRPAFRKLANTLTDTRECGGYLLATRIIEKGGDFRSWRLASLAGALLLTDKFDGWFARMSNIPSVEYTGKDQEADRKVYREVMTAVGTVTNDERYFIYVALTDARNNRVEKKRSELRQLDLDASSQFMGKLKTLLQDVGMVADLSPLGESYPGVVHAIHSSALATAAVSGVEIIVSADQQMSMYSMIHSETLVQ